MGKTHNYKHKEYYKMAHLKKKSDTFFNIWLKAFFVGAIYFFNRVAIYRTKKDNVQIAFRYELIKKAVKKVAIKKWGRYSFATQFAGMTANIVATFCTVDPAYGTLFDEFIEEYNNKKQKHKIK